MQKHRGEIVEKAVRKSKYPFSKLASKLSIKRSELCIRLKDPALSYEFIIAVGDVVHYDFSVEFPDLKPCKSNATQEADIDYIRRDTAELLTLQRKHMWLLERHNKLVHTLLRLANDNELYTLKEEIATLIATINKAADEQD